MNKTVIRSDLRLVAVSRIFGFFIFIGLVCFWPAGTWGYWQAWMWTATMIGLLTITLSYLWKNDKALLERRMRMREKQSRQQKIILVSGIFLTASFVLPGFDIRLGWSNMPAWGAIAADGVVILGYLLVIWVFKTNTFTSRVVEVEAGQHTITSGPYAIVRHPMYVGAFLTYAFSPLALGSYWAFIPGLMILPVLIFRIIDEEKLLIQELPGYPEYVQKVRFRLFPGIW